MRCTFLIAQYLIVSILAITPAVSQTHYSNDSIVAKIQERYSTLEDASADFIQKIKMKYSPTEQIQHGSVKIKKGNEYRIELPQLHIITDGKTVWLYSLSNHQVTIDSFKPNSSVSSPEKFLQGLPSDYSVSKAVQVKTTIVLSLIPSKGQKNSFLQELTLRVDPATWTVVGVHYTDRNRTEVTIDLSDIRFNSGIPDSEFEFVPPDSVSIVDLRTLR